MTDYRSKCLKIFEGAPTDASAGMTSYQYRKYLMDNADSLMEKNRSMAEETANPCGLTPAGTAAAPSAAPSSVTGFDGEYATLPQAF